MPQTIRQPSSLKVMPDVIRHPWGFAGKEWIPVSGTGMTGRGGVMPDVIRHPWGFAGKEWIPV